MSEQLLVVDELQVEIESSHVEIDEGVSLKLDQGEVLGLVGESASGKTTAATSLLAYQRRGARIAGGHVLLEGRDILALSQGDLRRVRGKLISYVPQDPSMSLNPALRIRTQLMEVLEEHGYGDSDEMRSTRLAAMMDEVMLPTSDEFLRRYPHQLSGGQQQRVVLAMAFACHPSVIVLDEPTTGLDVTTQAHVLETIRSLTATHDVSALYVTHDLAVVASVADRVAVMYAGRLVEVAPRDEIFGHARHPYTRKLISAVPRLKSRSMPEGIPGVAPRPGHRPVGCAFSGRCELATEQCISTVPPAESLEGGRLIACWHWKGRERAQSIVRNGVDCRFLRPSSETELLLNVKDLGAWYGRKQAVEGAAVSVRRGRCVALVGESGSGKTTFARCIAGLHKGRIEGSILFHDEPLKRVAKQRSRETRQAIQYVFQSPYSSLNPRKTVAQLLARPLRTFFRLSASELEARMVEALDHVALESSVLDRYPDQLSGGERQRVAIARALTAQPELLICDEVTSSLDVSVQATIVELLSGLIDSVGIAMVFVTHHLALVRAIAEDVIVMSNGRIVESGSTENILDRPLADYTRRLLSDTPEIPS